MTFLLSATSPIGYLIEFVHPIEMCVPRREVRVERAPAVRVSLVFSVFNGVVFFPSEVLDCYLFQMT